MSLFLYIKIRDVKINIDKERSLQFEVFLGNEKMKVLSGDAFK
jgi:hypothetical protein